MTLVIAEKVGQQITFSSDSRISFDGAGNLDFGIKIFSVPVKIQSPIDEATGYSSIDYDHKLGLAVIGNTLNSYLVKEAIYEILQHLQYIPGYTECSMEGISNLVLKVYSKVTLDLTNIMGREGRSQILLGGYCAVQNKIRVFEFYINKANVDIEPLCKEILQTDSILFFGLGDSEAKHIQTNYPQLSPLHILRKIIDENLSPSVGGGLQYGEFINNDFKIFGIENYELTPTGEFKDYTFTLRGLNLYKDELERGDNDFHISYDLKTPFSVDINKLLDKI